MSWWVPALILLVGVFLAARITKWVNWFTYGQNRERLLRELREEERNKRGGPPPAGPGKKDESR